MSERSRSVRARQWVLQASFNLLYTRLGFLHEAAGTGVYGSAWNGRRSHVVPADFEGTLLDLGCGEGRLLRSLAAQQVFAFGIEPSPVMVGRAARRHVAVVQATAEALPLHAGSIRNVVATYPGPWIIDPRTWDEIARVTTDGATVQILLGGDIVRGRGAFLRSRILRLAYGNTVAPEKLPVLGNDQIIGEYVWKDDRWGSALLWSGIRQARPSGQLLSGGPNIRQ